jgi:small conductance mechanosensitive channel
MRASRRQIRGTYAIALIFLLLGVLPAAADPTAGSESAVEEAAAPAAAESEREEDIARFESLRARRLANLKQAAALEADAATAIGDDELALRAQALELRLADVKTLQEMAGVIEALESREEDAVAQRSELAALLPPLWSAVEAAYARQGARLTELKTQREAAADAEAAAQLESSIQNQEALLLRLLAAAVKLTDVARTVGVPNQAQRAWLAERVAARARLASSHVHLAQLRLEDLAERAAAGDDPAALQASVASANHRLTSALQSLRSAVDMMDALELDPSAYQQLLIASTGELTVEAIDTRVAAELLSGWASGIRESLAKNGPAFAFRALLFVLVLALFWWLARFVRGVVSRAVEARHLRFSELLKRTLVSLSSGLVMLIGFLVAVSQLGFQIGPMLAGLGIAGFVIGFALQDTLGNFASGLMVLIYRPYDVGDMIDCAGGVFGKVSHMSLVSTTILTIDNKTLIVPNSKIWGDVITNVAAQRIRRVDLEFGIGYGDDIPHAEEVIWSVLKDHPKVLEDPEPVVKLHSLGDSSVNFVVRPWVESDDYWDVWWDLTREVKLRFDREGVSIPFPQRDVHFYPAQPEPEAKTPTTGAPDPIEVGSTPLSGQDPPDDDEA